MKKKRSIIYINEDLCDGCGECVPSCAEGAIQIVDGKARLVSDVYCDGLGACLGHCPKNALEIIEREAVEFDEEEVKKLLNKEAPPACPSVAMRFMGPSNGRPAAGSGTSASAVAGSAGAGTSGSALSHWPVQLRLVPPSAPFLKGADVLIAADCTAFSCADFHGSFLNGKALLIGCPKLDNSEAYLEKLADIFREANLKSVTVLVMEVPCCQGMVALVERAIKDSGVNVPLHTIVLGIRGEVVRTG